MGSTNMTAFGIRNRVSLTAPVGGTLEDLVAGEGMEIMRNDVSDITGNVEIKLDMEYVRRSILGHAADKEDVKNYPDLTKQDMVELGSFAPGDILLVKTNAGFFMTNYTECEILAIDYDSCRLKVRYQNDMGAYIESWTDYGMMSCSEYTVLRAKLQTKFVDEWFYRLSKEERRKIIADYCRDCGAYVGGYPCKSCGEGEVQCPENSTTS